MRRKTENGHDHLKDLSVHEHHHGISCEKHKSLKGESPIFENFINREYSRVSNKRFAHLFVFEESPYLKLKSSK